MAGINIPGVSDKYKTGDLVDALMKAERIPLTREQDSLDKYKEQQNAWRDVNQKLSSVRDSVKSLYSFDNPFNNKLSTSSDEQAITATAARDAEYGSFKIDVIKPATADRFMSESIQKNFNIAKGVYTFLVADKSVSFNWKGGNLSDFVSAINKRSNNVIKADVIGMEKDKKALLIEALKTGERNHLVFKDEALKLAKQIHIISNETRETDLFGISNDELLAPPLDNQQEQDGMPPISNSEILSDQNGTIVPPRGGFAILIPEKYQTEDDVTIEFSALFSQTADITDKLNESLVRPELPEMTVEFGGITIVNDKSETSLPDPDFIESLVPIADDRNFVYVCVADGSELPLSSDNFEVNEETGELKVSINTSSYDDIQSIVIKNCNTGEQISLSPFSIYSKKSLPEYIPEHAISTAGDAEIKYEGITVHRSTNDIDDLIPNVTLNVKNATDSTAIISVSPDAKSAKDALITFIGKYNQAMAEINILSQDKPEIVTELDYLSEDERDIGQKRLGMFFSDFSLTNVKSQMQRILSANYNYKGTSGITMLSQIGISTKAAGGGGYTPGRFRGYLEVDEKKLDENLENNLDSIKNLFGYDSDGDLVIDSGIGFALDKQITSYVQSGGVIATKTKAIDTQIKASESRISKLQAQLDNKESELKSKYGQMESTLNSLENQKSSISNFSNINKGNQ